MKLRDELAHGSPEHPIQRQRRRLDHGHLNPEATSGRRHLGADEPRADDDEPIGASGEIVPQRLGIRKVANDVDAAERGHQLRLVRRGLGGLDEEPCRPPRHRAGRDDHPVAGQLVVVVKLQPQVIGGKARTGDAKTEAHVDLATFDP